MLCDFLQLGGFAFLLPHDNIPTTRIGVRTLDVEDASNNFGTFIAGEQEVTGLQVANYANVKGFGGQALGWGVQTQVLVCLFVMRAILETE